MGDYLIGTQQHCLKLVSLFSAGGGVLLLEKCIHIYMAVWLWLSDCCGWACGWGQYLVRFNVEGCSVLFFSGINIMLHYVDNLMQ